MLVPGATLLVFAFEPRLQKHGFDLSQQTQPNECSQFLGGGGEALEYKLPDGCLRKNEAL